MDGGCVLAMSSWCCLGWFFFCWLLRVSSTCGFVPTLVWCEQEEEEEGGGRNVRKKVTPARVFRWCTCKRTARSWERPRYGIPPPSPRAAPPAPHILHNNGGGELHPQPLLTLLRALFQKWPANPNPTILNIPPHRSHSAPWPPSKPPGADTPPSEHKRGGFFSLPPPPPPKKHQPNGEDANGQPDAEASTPRGIFPGGVGAFSHPFHKLKGAGVSLLVLEGLGMPMGRAGAFPTRPTAPL